jgi:hypothetical protein
MRFSHSTAEVIKELRISESTLRRLRREGVLKPGTHYRLKGLGTERAPLMWDPAATDAALAQRSRRALSA